MYTPPIKLSPQEKAYVAIYRNVKRKHGYGNDALWKHMTKQLLEKR